RKSGGPEVRTSSSFPVVAVERDLVPHLLESNRDPRHGRLPDSRTSGPLDGGNGSCGGIRIHIHHHPDPLTTGERTEAIEKGLDVTPAGTLDQGVPAVLALEEGQAGRIGPEEDRAIEMLAQTHAIGLGDELDLAGFGAAPQEAGQT